jgi:copper transport protein
MPPAFLVRVVLAWLAVALVTPGAAAAHSAFLGSDPAPGARLAAAPQAITLTFTEPLNPHLSRASIAAVEDGRRVGAVVSRDGMRLVLRPRTPLARGAYRVAWHTVSTEDGHALEGTFSIGVRAAAAGGVHAVEQSPLARGGWLRVITRWLLYATLIVFTGALLLGALLGGGRGRGWPVPEPLVSEIGEGEAGALRARERLLAGELGLAAAGLAAAAAAADAYDAGGSLAPDVLRDYLLTNSAGITRVAVVVLVLVAALATRAGARRAAALPAVFALVALAASGHAGSAPAPGLAIAADALHLVAGSAWLGGMGALVLLWGPLVRSSGAGARRAVARHVLPVFGRVALPAFAVVVVTGTASAVIELGHLDALGGTAYGRILALKVFLVAVIAAISREHALRLRPRLPATAEAPATAEERRHWRLWRSEPLLGLGVTAAVAFLVAFPLPPRQLSDADDARASAPAAALCDPCPLPRPRADELAVAENAGAQLVGAWIRRTATGLAGTVRVVDVRGRPWRRAFRIENARQQACGTACSRFTRRGRGPLVVRVPARSRVYTARLGTEWSPGASTRARRLLGRAQAAMRALRSARQTEEQTSGPGSYARTDYVLRAPDRMRLSTDTGTRSVIIGERQWLRTRDSGGWLRQRFGSGLPFATRRWFRWTPFAVDVRWIGSRRDSAGRLLTEIAMVDPGTPVWSRLTIDRATGRILRERSHNPGHYADERYFGFNRPVRIEAPDG